MKLKPPFALLSLSLSLAMATASCSPAAHWQAEPNSTKSATEIGLFEVLDGDGSPVRLPIPGVPTVLAFVEPHCPPCKRTVADLDRLARRQSSSGVRFYIATPLENLAQTRLSLQGSPITTLVDPTGVTYRDVGAKGVPAVVFFDAKSAQVALVEENGFDSLHKALLRVRCSRWR